MDGGAPDPARLPARDRPKRPRAPNLFYAFGHQHLGVTLAATTGEAVAALVAGDGTGGDFGPFLLTRFEGAKG